jgi:hypothetical protein
MNSRRIVVGVMMALYILFGLLGIFVSAPNTFVGADLSVYQRAGNDLLSIGDPYASNATAHFNFQYRYPPLLAMLMPLLGWPPVWFALLWGSTALVFYFWWRDAGWFGLAPIFMLSGPWGQVLLNGNVQPLLMGLLVLVPYYRRVGAISLAVATMLKLHPILGVVWYLGRRDWTGLAWYAGAIVALLVVQAPWLAEFLDFYANDPDASITLYAGWGLRLAGDVAWLIGAGLAGIAALALARTRYGWLMNIVFQLAALPRLLPTNLALLLAAPLPTRRRPRTLESAARQPEPVAAGSQL